MLRARRLGVLQWRAASEAAAAAGRLRSRNAIAEIAGSSTRLLVSRNSSQSLLVRWQSTTPSLADAPEQLKMQGFMSELDTCRESGNWRQALKLLDRIDKEGYPLDAAMYERTIAACARMGKVEVIPGLLQNMTVDDILPTSATVDFIMQAYLSREEWGLLVEHALYVTEKRVPLSEAAFQATMEACGQTRDAKSTKAIFANVEATGHMNLTTSHYAAAIRAVGMGGRPDLAVSLFTRMEEVARIPADELVFSQLIRSQIVNHALPQALQTFVTVNERELMLQEPIYTATIDALIKNNDYWQACRLFDQMISYNMSPSVFCYGRVMVAYVRTGKNDHAWACWKKIVESNEPAPALMKYTRLMADLASTSDSKLTLAVFGHIYSLFDHAQIRETTYSLGIRAHGRLGDTQTAVDLFDRFVESRHEVGKSLPRAAGIYLAVFNALSRDTHRDPKQNTLDAKRVWDIMAENVPVILPPAYASLAGVFASSGELATLDELLDHAGQRFAEQDESEYDEFDQSEELDETNTTDACDQLLFNGVISGFSKARTDQSAQIVSYLKTMKKRGLAINDSIVRASTDAFIKFEKWPLMMELTDYVDTKALSNADLCFGDTISKLLEAQAWSSARHWIAFAHKKGVQPPIRGKMEVLQQLRESKSDEWRIAYALALETLSFRQMVELNAESVADAVEVCANANRPTLVTRLFERLASHKSLQQRQRGVDAAAREPACKIPLRMYKSMVLSLMREPTSDADEFQLNIRRAEQICAEMLQLYGKEIDGEALSMAISIKATIGDDDDVMAMYETMQQLELEPNTYAQNAAIIAYSRARRVAQVLAIRDQLVAKCEQDASFDVDPNVMKSLLFSLAIAKQDELLKQTAGKFPCCQMDHVMGALLQANRVDQAVECFDESVSLDTFNALLKRISETKPGHRAHDPAIGATLLLKFVDLHGVDAIKPISRVMKLCKALVAHGHLQQAGQILHLYSNPDSNVQLKDIKPFHQQEAMEMLLFIHGEQCDWEQLGRLFDRKLLAFPLNVRHYELAMEYCTKVALPSAKAAPELVQAGAIQALKLFETLRRQFVKPNGAVYVLALQSCLRLQLLDKAGKRIVDDAKDQGFDKLIMNELEKVAAKALAERTSGAPAGDAANSPVRRGRKLKGALLETPPFTVNALDVAQLALFCHHQGISVSAKAARSLVAMRAYLPANVVNELQFLLDMRDESSSPRKSSGAAGARWGDLYLHPVPAPASEEDKNSH